MTLWMVRSGAHGEGDDVALSERVVGIGWPEIGDLAGVTDAVRLRERLEQAYPTDKAGRLANWTGQIEAFCRGISIGDRVALPLKRTPTIAFGTIAGEYRYVPDAIESMRHQRAVTWTHEVPRDSIPQDLLYSFGAFLTVCRIQRNHAERRIEAILDGSASPTELGHDPVPPPIQLPPTDVAAENGTDLAQLAQDSISKHIGTRFHGHDFARLVAAVLRAQGWYVEESRPGPDGGVDILAGEGAMGLDGTSLVVQVKSGSQRVDAPTLRELQGVMANFGTTRGLLVSWGGFTREAEREARRLYFQIRLWDSAKLVSEVTNHYSRFPQAIRSELPLQQVWVLVPNED